MGSVSAAELAGMLGVTRGRISQMVGEGKLDGCYSGSGRERRFDPVAAAKAIGKKVDPGQRLGNGAGTQAAIDRILRDEERPSQRAEHPAPRAPSAFGGLGESSEYEAARTAKAQEEARRLRRMNAEAEGQFVLADEVAREVRRQVGQEVAEVLTFIRSASRSIADRFGLDAREVRSVMLDQWRVHRGARAAEAEAAAESATMTQAEVAADI